MVFAAPTDKRPQLLPVREIGEGYDAAIDGLPLILDWAGEGGFYNSLGSQDAAGYEAQSEEIGISQTSTSDKISENKLNENEFWRTMRDFRGGISQRRFDVPDVSDDSAYWESRGVDPRRTGGLVLARKTVAAAPSTFSPSRFSADAAFNGFWFISENSGSQQSVTHYDFSTFTTKTRVVTNKDFYHLAVAPDDTCYIASEEGIFKVTTGTSITAHLTGPPAAFRICVAKQRIFIIGHNGPTTNNYSIYEVPLEGTITATLKLNPGPGLVGADVKEAGALVLFAFNPFPSYALDPIGPGIIYGYDGTNAPNRVLTLPKGEEILGMHPILGGAQVLIFVRRMDANQNIRGVLYLVDVNGTQLSNARIVFEYPEQFTKFNAARESFVSVGRHVIFPGAIDPNHPGGVGVDAYDIVNGTVSHLLLPPTVETATAPIWVSQYKGRIAFGIKQSGAFKVISESATDYLADGIIDTSIIDLNVDAPKLWNKVEAACLSLTAGQKIELYWTADDPASSTATWTLLAALHPGMSSLIVPLGVQSAKLALRAKLIAPGTPTSTPTLTKLGVGALMARPPALVHHMKILAYADMEKNNGDLFEHAAEDYWWRLSEQLEGMRVTGRPVWVQTPASRYDGHVHRARVGQMVRRTLNNTDKGQGGLIAVKLANIEPDRRNLLPLPVASFGAVPITLAVGDVFEIVGTGVTLAKETTLQPWTPGATSFVKVTPDSNSDGIRGPAPHQQVPWNPVLRKGQPLSASVMVRPYADNMSFQLAVEAWDAANTLIQTDTSATFALGVGSTGQWLPLTLEDFNYDTRTVLLFLTVKVVVTAGFAAFGVDAAQLEQAFIATPWVPPPTNV